MIAGLASLGLGLNTEIALETADNAVTNNFMEHFAPRTGITGMAFLDKAEERARIQAGLNGEDWDSLSIQDKFRRIQGHLGREDLVAMKELLRLAGDGARNHLFGGRGLDSLKNDVSYFCDLTSDRIQGWRDEGRRTGESVSDVFHGNRFVRGCLGMVGDWGGLGVGAFLSLAGISRGGGTKAGSLRPSIKYGHHYPSGRVVGANGNRGGVANDNTLRQTVKQQKVVGESSGALLTLPNGQVGQFIKGPGKPGQSSSRLTLLMSNGNAQGAGQTLKVQQGRINTTNSNQIPTRASSLQQKNPLHAYHKAPEKLKAFPAAQEAKEKTPVQGGGKLRERWKDKKYIYEWDSQHGTVEKYNKRGIHIGEFDPVTGEQLKPKNPKRKIEP